MTVTFPREFSIQDDFPPVDYDQWRALVEKALAGAPFEKKLVLKTYDGLRIQPLYSRRDDSGRDDPMGFPGLATRVRGGRPLGSVQSGWDLRQEFSAPCPVACNQAILADLSGGVTSIQIRLDQAARNGLDPDDAASAGCVGRDGVMVYGVDDMDKLLGDVQLELITVALDAGAAFFPAAATLMATWNRRGVSPETARAALNADPLGELARRGTLPLEPSSALSMMSDLASWTSEHYPHVTSVGVDSSPYHDGGASAAQDIAFSLATGVEYLRAMTAAGMDVSAAAEQILFRVSLGTEHFQAIAKLRAARWLWSRVLESCGVPEDSRSMRIHTRTGNRVLTKHDPSVNLLRNSVAVFAAGIGGADAITSVPFDVMAGLSNDFSRRVARNSALVLQEESHLHRVIDPAGGSWFLDRLTEDVAGKAWEIFQETERQGGMLAALTSGWVAKEIAATAAARAKDVATRKRGITGVSEFANVGEEPVIRDAPDLESLAGEAADRIRGLRSATQETLSLDTAEDRVAAAVAAASDGATLGQIAAALGLGRGQSATIAAIEPHRLAEPFDQLRDACDAWQDAQGKRPRVFLANLGPVSHYSGRATWSSNFFAAGGFEVLDSGGFADADAAAEAFSQTDASIAVICSSDKLYADVVPTAAAKLKQAGASSVVLAGNPGDNEQAWKAAGVDRFIFMRCDVLETLRSLLTQVGVIEEGEPVR
ncbi:methylmalonyl-CoA mutase subunit beta [Stieleria sp. ICT_E10.1]|uniref:methylmalonyl-CoA mutase subunit beta n=1 Tax=Stieleria sedimenti TaxID=2976331 RepID=UPI00217FEDA5|nr:methylmalonyl-CoA mutase subunit beta [Stieleria sedimenti]MCS7467016.1 methylmalonyl-CoA mutase subunit beta [Stieleria sedimenti]